MNTHPIRRWRTGATLASSALLWLAACSHAQGPAPTPAPGAPPKADPAIAELVEAHNKERAKENLPPLALEAKLTEAADGHARDMAAREIMTHEGADGSTAAQRVASAGYRYRSTGENVAKGYRQVADVVEVWMNSPPHKKNILGDYTEIGAARAESKEGKLYWCVEFGKPYPKFDPTAAAASLSEVINDRRKIANLPSLAVDPALAKAAGEQAAALAKKHGQAGATASLDGVDAKKYQDLALSTATGQPDADTVLKGYLDDPGLKGRILGKYTQIGTGYATAEDGTPYWCLILATPARR